MESRKQIVLRLAEETFFFQKIYIFFCDVIAGWLMEVVVRLKPLKPPCGTLLVVTGMLLIIWNGLPYLVGPSGYLNINSRMAEPRMIATSHSGNLLEIYQA